MRRILLILIVLTFAGLLAAGCGKFGKKYDGGGTTTSASDEARLTDAKFTAANRAKDGCTDIKEFKDAGRQHSTNINEKLTYDTNPPTSGKHYQVPVEWGIYDTEQKDVQTTHNLEHGHIDIFYKGLSDKEKATLLKQVKVNPYHLVVAPRKADPKDGVYYSVWTRQIYCAKPSKVALQYMIDTWRDQGPELFTDDMSKQKS